MPPKWSFPEKDQAQFLLAECYTSYPPYLTNLTIYSEQCGKFRHVDTWSCAINSAAGENKVKFALEKATNAPMGSKGTALLFHYPRRSMSGRSGWVRRISPLTGTRSPYYPTRSDSLYRLSYPSTPATGIPFKNNHRTKQSSFKTILASHIRRITETVEQASS